MSRLFNGTSDLAQVVASIMAATPFTVCAWVKPAAVTAEMAVAGGFDTSDTTVDANSLIVAGNVAGDPVRAYTVTGGSGFNFSDINGVTAGVWQHIAGVWSSITSRQAFLNAVGGGANTTSDDPSAAIDTFIIGARRTSSVTGTYFEGLIAEVAVWNVALTQTQLEELAAGAAATEVAPESLAHYWTLESDGTDSIGSADLTFTGTTHSEDHPTITGGEPPVPPPDWPEEIVGGSVIDYTPFWRIEVRDGTRWIDLTRDVLQSETMSLSTGIHGPGMLDQMATTGEFNFTLRNDPGNQAGVEGWYSPGHIFSMPNWDLGLVVRISFSVAGTAPDRVKFYGLISDIDPMMGKHSFKVSVSARDLVSFIWDAFIAMSVLTNKTDAELITAILDELPTSIQPLARNIDEGIDVVEYSFSDVPDGATAGTLLNEIVTSHYGLLFIQGDGTIRYMNRYSRFSGEPEAILDGNMHSLSAPTTVDLRSNLIAAKIYERNIEPATGLTFWSLPEVQYIPSGESYEVKISYQDPDDRDNFIGLVNASITNVVYGTNPDGTGVPGGGLIINLFDDNGSSGNFSLSNGSTDGIYLVSAQVIADSAVYEETEDLQYSTEQPYGIKRLSFDLRYQDSFDVASGMSQLYLNVLAARKGAVSELRFLANKSPDLMKAAVELELGANVLITEAKSGVSARECRIVGVEYEIREGGILYCTWYLHDITEFKSSFANVWTLDESTFDDETVLGI
jgi:hypothetical protein